MDVFVDTNVLVAAVAEKGEKSKIAQELLESENRIYTSLLNVMELRTVLTKKKRVKQDKAEETVQEVVQNLEIIIPDSSDFIESNKLQVKTLLYPQDCLILQIADSQGCELASFDGELIDNGAERPEDIL